MGIESRVLAIVAVVLFLGSAFAGSPPSERVYIDSPTQKTYSHEWPVFRGTMTGTSDATEGKILIYCARDGGATKYYWDGSQWTTQKNNGIPLCTGTDCASWEVRTPPPPIEAPVPDGCYVLVTAVSTGLAYEDVTFWFIVHSTQVNMTDPAILEGTFYSDYSIEGFLDSGEPISYRYGVYVIGRSEDCRSKDPSNLPNSGNGRTTGRITYGYDQKACVVVRNQYGKDSWRSSKVVPVPRVSIEEPEGDTYEDVWPADMHGDVRGYMEDSSVLANLRCAGYYWNGEGWSEEDVNIIPEYDSESWELFVPELPPLTGPCRLTVYHVGSLRETKSASVNFWFRKTPVEIEVISPFYWESGEEGFQAAVHFDDEVEGVEPPEYNVYYKVVERNEACSDENMEFKGTFNGEYTLYEYIGMDEKLCVLAVDVYGRERRAEAVVPEPGVEIQEPTRDTYRNTWPNISGELTGVLRTSEAYYVLRCGNKYWQEIVMPLARRPRPEGAWVDEYTENTLHAERGEDPTYADWQIDVHPPTIGECNLTVYHRDEDRNRIATETKLFTVTKKAPEIEVAPLPLWKQEGNRYKVEYDVWELAFRYESGRPYRPHYVVMVGRVERDGNCREANYNEVYAGTMDMFEGEETLAYNKRVCIRVVDEYNQSAEEEIVIPDANVYISLGDAYHNTWPPFVSGRVDGHLQGDVFSYVFECNDWYWNGDSWETKTNRVEVNKDLGDSGHWTIRVDDPPPTTGTCTFFVRVRNPARPEANAEKSFEFSVDPSDVNVLLAGGEPVANGCMRDVPKCRRQDMRVEINVLFWRYGGRIYVRCGEGNWIEMMPVRPREQEDGWNLMRFRGTMRDLNRLAPGIYEQCMQEGNVRMDVRYDDYFGRTYFASDDVLYARDAWKITYELRKGWNFIGIPFVPYTPGMEGSTDENVESVWLYSPLAGNWRVFRKGCPELSSLAAFEQGKAYMIWAEGPASVSVWGHYVPMTNTDPPMPVEIFRVYSGWNPVAFDLRPGDQIDSETAFGVLNSKEVYTLGHPFLRNVFWGEYWVLSGALWGSPIYGTKGYWVHTTDNNVPVHSKYNHAEGCCW